MKTGSGLKPTENPCSAGFCVHIIITRDNKGGRKMHDEPLTVSVSTEDEPSLTPGELKALVARIRQQFDRPLPEQ